MDGPYRDIILKCKTILLICRETCDGLKAGNFDSASRISSHVQRMETTMRDYTKVIVLEADRHSKSELELGLSNSFPLLSKDLGKNVEDFISKSKAFLDKPSSTPLNIAQRYELETRQNAVMDTVRKVLNAVQLWSQWEGAAQETMQAGEGKEGGHGFKAGVAEMIKELLDAARALRDFCMSSTKSSDSTMFVGMVRQVQKHQMNAQAAVLEMRGKGDEDAIKTSGLAFISQTRLRYRDKCADEEVTESYKEFKDSLLAFLRNANANQAVLHMMNSTLQFPLVEDAKRPPKEEVDPEEKRLRMLGLSQNEFLETESKYYLQLNSLVMGFVEPLRKDPALIGLKPLTQFDFSSLLTSLVSLEGLTKMLVGALKDEMKPGGSKKIGSLFNKKAQTLRLYSAYINVYDDGMERLTEARRESKAFDAFCVTYAQSAGMQDVSFAFILPVQRCPRYEMLLANLLKFTQAADSEHGELSQAVAKVREVNTFINVKKRQDQNRKKLMEIQNAIQWGAKPRTLVEQGNFRQYVREGVLESGKKEAYYWILLSDVLIKLTLVKNSGTTRRKSGTTILSSGPISAGLAALTPGGGASLSASTSSFAGSRKYTLLAYLLISKISLEELPGDNVSFKIIEDDTNAFHLCNAVSEDECVSWIKDIRAALDVNKL